MYLPNNTQLQGGKYTIVRHISSGGFGNTYQARHTLLDTQVAIKEFAPKMFCGRDDITLSITTPAQANKPIVDKLRASFFNEARAIFQMNHPNIVKVNDVFEENGTAYYVMDLIEGQSLHQMVQHGPLPEAVAVVYIPQGANALAYGHSLNRLHLDIKPGNIMIDTHGRAILLDFGASKHYNLETGENTSTLLGINTPGYAPIELQSQGFSKFSPATDIYSLGATLYKLLTGQIPPDSTLLMAGETTLLSLPPSISASTRKAIEAAMQLRRVDRPQTVGDFCKLLNGAKKEASQKEDVTMMEEEKATSGSHSEHSRRQEKLGFISVIHLLTTFSIMDYFLAFEPASSSNDHLLFLSVLAIWSVLQWMVLHNLNNKYSYIYIVRFILFGILGIVYIHTLPHTFLSTCLDYTRVAIILSPQCFLIYNFWIAPKFRKK